MPTNTCVSRCRPQLTAVLTVLTLVIGNQSTTHAQSARASTSALPFRPIGAPSLVDRYVAPSGPSPITGLPVNKSQTWNGPPSGIRQVAMQSGGFDLPSNGLPLNNAPATTTPFTAPPGNPIAPETLAPPTTMVAPSPATLAPPPTNATPLPGGTTGLVPQTLAPQTRAPATGIPVSPSDLQQMPAPALNNGGFATMADCRLITPPSSYSALAPVVGGGCGGTAPVGYLQPVSATAPYIPPQQELAGPAVVMPPPIAGPPASAPAGSLVSFGQERYPVQVGQGLWGQPVAYVPGQSFRNWLRYFSF